MLSIKSQKLIHIFLFGKIILAGPWTIFAPTNKAFRNLPMRELEDLVEDKSRLSRLLLSHLVNRSMYSAGLRSHQKIEMANGRHVNVFARKSKYLNFIFLVLQKSNFYKSRFRRKRKIDGIFGCCCCCILTTARRAFAPSSHRVVHAQTTNLNPAVRRRKQPLGRARAGISNWKLMEIYSLSSEAR